MSVRLTNAMRESICRELLKQRFEAEEEVLLNDKLDFADRCYNAVYSPEERKIMSKLPNGYMPTCTETSFCFQKAWYALRFRNAKRIPWADRNSWHAERFSFSDENLLVKEWAELQRRSDSLKEMKSEAKTKIMAILRGISTVKRLLETWPEVAPWLPASEADASINLPAVPVAEINAMLNLKSAKKAA